MDIRHLIDHRIVLFDGATGTEIQKRLGKNLLLPFGDLLNIEEPSVIKDIHISYIKAGADVIETNTFNSNPVVLSKWGKENLARELNIKAVEIAKSAIKESTRDVIIAGSVGPSDVSLSLGCNISFDEMKNSYRVQVEALLSAGVDILIFETAHDIVNLKAALIALVEVVGKNEELAAIASVTLDKNGFMLCGHDINSAYFCLENFDLIAFGINCSVGPKEMERYISELSKISRFPVFVMPNAGFADESGNYDVGAEEFAEIMLNYARKGYINIAGGCCGTGPKHIEMLSKIKNIKPRYFDKTKRVFSISHKQSFSDIDTQPPYIMSERTNIVGSKSFSKICEEGDVGKMISFIKDEVEKGIHGLDISFISKERDEIKDFLSFFPEISKAVKIPFSIDSTDATIFENASKISGGRLIFNSVNFEKGRDRVSSVMDLAQKYGCNVVFGLIWEDGKLPFSFDEKMKNALLIYSFIKEKGFPKNLVIFDPLVFPLASSYRYSARDTILACGEIKKRFGVKTLLGISNVSYGITRKARGYINSCFLYHAIKNGLDIAILNPSDRIPYSDIDEKIRKLADSIITDGRLELLREFVEMTSGLKENLNEFDISTQSQHDLLKAMIIKGRMDFDDILYGLVKSFYPIDIINNIVVPAMNDVGRKFADGEYIITDVLSSASSAKKVIEYLEPYIKTSAVKRAKLLIATVKGDVHDIGKNLVSIVFSANGFEVFDLGVRVEPEIIVKKAKELMPDFIGLSGLLVKSQDYMLLTALLLKEGGLTIPVIVGGAGVSRRFVEMKMREVYPQSFYASDALEGVEIAKKILFENKAMEEK